MIAGPGLVRPLPDLTDTARPAISSPSLHTPGPGTSSCLPAGPGLPSPLPSTRRARACLLPFPLHAGLRACLFLPDPPHSRPRNLLLPAGLPLALGVTAPSFLFLSPLAWIWGVARSVLPNEPRTQSISSLSGGNTNKILGFFLLFFGPLCAKHIPSHLVLPIIPKSSLIISVLQMRRVRLAHSLVHPPTIIYLVPVCSGC